MTNLGNLYYTLGLDNSSFLKAVKSIDPTLNDLKQKMAALGVEWDKLGKTDTTRYKQAIKLLSQIQQEQQKMTREAYRTQKAMQGINGQVNLQKGALGQMVGLAGKYVSVLGAAQLIKSMVRITGEFEIQRTTMAAILRDAQAASELISQIKELAVISPFQFKELTSYTKQLSAYSIPKEDLYETTKMLADVSAGIGIDMQRLILAFGQIRSASFLRGQEVRQMTESGIPVLEELAKQFTQITGDFVSAGEVFDKISDRQVPFEMIEKMFKNMTSEGGKFYQMQEIQAATLQGKISNLKDAWDIMLNDLGENSTEVMKNFVDWIRKCIENIQDVGKVLIPILSTMGILSLFAQTIAFFSTGALSNATKLFPVVRNIKLLLDTMKLGKGALALTSKIGLIAAALAAIGTLIRQISRAHSALAKELDSIDKKYTDFANQSVNVLEKLRAKLADVTEGSQAWRDTISQINSQYGDHLQYIITETEALEGQKSALTQLDEQYKSTQRSVRQYYERAKIEEKKRKIEDASGIDDQKDELVDYLTGHLQGMNNGNGVAISEADIRSVVNDYANIIRQVSPEERKNVKAGYMGDTTALIHNKTLYGLLMEKYKGTNFQSSAAFKDYLLQFTETIWNLEDEFKDIGEVGGYSFYQEEKLADDIEQKFQEKKNAAYAYIKTDQEKYDTMIAEAQSYRLQNLMRLYAPTTKGHFDSKWNWVSDTDVRNMFSDNSMFNQYQSELRTLTTPPENWRQDVAAAQKKFSIWDAENSNNNTFVNFGVTKDTKLPALIEDMRKKYKQNKEDIEALVDAREDVAKAAKRESMKSSNKAIEELFSKWGLTLETEKETNKSIKTKRDNYSAYVARMRDIADLVKDMMKLESDATDKGYTAISGAKQELVGILTNMVNKREDLLKEPDVTSIMKQMGVSQENIDKYALSLQEALKKYDIVNPEEIKVLLARMAQETNLFRLMEEAGDVSKYKGWHGRGGIQLTGKGNYEAFEADTGYNVTSDPSILVKNPAAAMEAAAWYYAKNNLSEVFAEFGAEGVWKMINTGSATGKANGIADTQKLYDLVKDFYTASEGGDLFELLTPKDIGNVNNYREALELLLEKISTINTSGAQSLREYIRGILDGDKSDDFENTYKAAKELEKTLREFGEGNYMPDDAPISRKVASIANKLRSELNKIGIEQEETNKTFIKRWGGSVSTNKDGVMSWLSPDSLDEQQVKQAMDEWDRLLNGYNDKKNYATWEAQGRINNLSKDWRIKLYRDAGIFSDGQTNFDRLERMSASSLSSNIDEIDNLIELLEKGDFDPAFEKSLGETTLSLKKLKELLKGDFEFDKEDNINEKTKKIKENLNAVIDGAGQVAGALGNLGEVKGDQNLIKMAKVFDEMKGTVTDIVSLMIDGFKGGADSFKDFFSNIAKSADWITMIIKIVLELISLIINASANALKKEQELAAAALEWANALKMARVEAYLAAEAMKNIFGEDALGQIDEWNKAAHEAMSNIKLNNVALVSLGNSTGGRRPLHAFPNQFQVGKGKKAQDLKDVVPEFYDGDNIDYSKLEKFVGSDWYNQLSSDEQRQWFDEQLELWNKFKESVANIASYLSNVFGNVADTISDNMLDAFIRTGNAAIDMGNIISDVAKTFAQDMIKSFIMEEYLNSASDAIKSVSSEYDEKGAKNENYIADKNERLNAIMGFFIDAVTDLDREGTAYINQLLDGLKGWLGSGDTENAGVELSKISEETGGIIASYVNAIRAYCASMDSTKKDIRDDVSGIHLLMIEMATNIADIKLNTSNNAAYAGEIRDLLSRLTASGGALKLNVKM